jgi:hypothetical protein
VRGGSPLDDPVEIIGVRFLFLALATMIGVGRIVSRIVACARTNPPMTDELLDGSLIFFTLVFCHSLI